MSTQIGYNTNLAAEYHVLSMLHRKGIDANLTLGNKKSVDIVVQGKKDHLLTVDVKGLANSTAWRLGNQKGRVAPNHYYALVDFKGKIDQHDVCPETWIVPSTCTKDFLYEHKTAGRFFQRPKLRKKGKQYLENWKQLA